MELRAMMILRRIGTRLDEPYPMPVLPPVLISEDALYPSPEEAAKQPSRRARPLAGRRTVRHARPCAGHPPLRFARARKTWVAGTSPAMTKERASDLLPHEPVPQRADARDVDLDDVASLQVGRGAVGAHPDHVARRQREIFA